MVINRTVAVHVGTVRLVGVQPTTLTGVFADALQDEFARLVASHGVPAAWSADGHIDRVEASLPARAGGVGSPPVDGVRSDQASPAALGRVAARALYAGGRP